MPVTAKLLRKFYEKLGDDIANELVETLLTRRMFNFWVAQAATTVGLRFAAVKLAH